MLANEIRSGTFTEIQSRTRNKTALPWTVIVYDDPVNLMQYVTMVFKKVFGYSDEKAIVLMKQVHEKGRSLVWSGEKEKAEFYVQQLHSFQLKASLEQES